MKRIYFFLVLLLLSGGILYAQGVSVQINGGSAVVLDESNGLYFHNDSLTLNGEVFALDDIQMITFEYVSGIADIQNIESLELLPNPASDIITLRGIGGEPQTMVLYSTAGIKLMEQTVIDGTIVNISHLPEGVYILRCGDRVAKMVKQL